jgi:Uri superfamily endonuclease
MILRVRVDGQDKTGEAWPAAPGSYLLVLRVARELRARAGALGVQELPAGAYVYCGSALGPGGLRARVRRHVEGARRLHWHIDYLLRRAGVQEVWIRTGAQRLECEWASALDRLEEFDCPVPGFGASDCRCRAHLWRVMASGIELEYLLERLPSAPRRIWRAGAETDML